MSFIGELLPRLPLPFPGLFDEDEERGDRVFRDPAGNPVDIPKLIEELTNPALRPPPDPVVDPEAPAPPEPPPTPPPPPSPEPPPREVEEPPPPEPPRVSTVPQSPLPEVPRRARARVRPRGEPESAFPSFPSHVLAARRPVDFPRPYGPRFPRGTPTHPSNADEIIKRVDRAIGRIIKRHVDKRKKLPPPSGGWSWEVYRQQAERAMRDSAIRRGRRPDTPVQVKRRRTTGPHPPPPTPFPSDELEQLERELDEELARNAMPPLRRTAESRGFGDIRHSFPRPAPAPLPPPVPEIAIPPISTPTPAPVPVPASTPQSQTVTLPRLGAAAGVLAALGVAAIVSSRSKTPQATRSATRATTSTPTETFTPVETSQPVQVPTPTPTPTPISPPAPPLTPTKTPLAESAGSSRCQTPKEQRKEDRERRKKKRQECKQFLSVRVPAHKRKMCIGDLAKYLFRKAQRTARAAIKKRIIAELEERGVNARELLKLTKRPRRKKAEVEVGGVEIDFEDLIGGK